MFLPERPIQIALFMWGGGMKNKYIVVLWLEEHEEEGNLVTLLINNTKSYAIYNKI